MNSSPVISALLSLTSLWSNEIIKANALQSEYTMAINVILTEIVKYLSVYITNEFMISSAILIAVVLICKKYNLKLFNFNSILKQKNSVSVYADEIIKNEKKVIDMSKAFKAVNKMLLIKYTFKSINFLNDADFDIIVGEITEQEIEPNIFVSVVKTGQTTVITLSSYNKNMKQFLTDTIEKYGEKNTKYTLKIIGTEPDDTTVEYPPIMTTLTYILIRKYKMTCLKVMAVGKSKDEWTELHVENAKNYKKDICNALLTDSEQKQFALTELIDALPNMYQLDSYHNYQLEDDIYITIERFGKNVIYLLSSNTKDLQQFVKDCISEQITKLSIDKYKYNVKMTGVEYPNDSSGSIVYSKEMIILNDHLIKNLKNTQIRYTTTSADRKALLIIDEIHNASLDGIIFDISKFLINPQHQAPRYMITYTLSSNDVDISKYIKHLVTEYDNEMSEKNKNIVYYFKYLGKIGDNYKFRSYELSSPKNTSYETFEHIHNEHIQRLIHDIDQLKNLEYYKKHGSRRKKSYLFYGEPGCGKNAAIIAMALHDKRHVIDIPMSILQFNSEFEHILNLTTINDVKFEKGNVIYMFDEMHVGLSKIINTNTPPPDPNASTVETAKIIAGAINTLTTGEAQPSATPSTPTTFDKLDMSCILSVLDGIGNYGGSIYVGLTNFIDQIPEPLKREMRLTPLYFTFLRKSDAITIIEKYFDTLLTEQQQEKIQDRKITPAKLRMLCEINEHNTIDELIDQLA